MIAGQCVHGCERVITMGEARGQSGAFVITRGSCNGDGLGDGWGGSAVEGAPQHDRVAVYGERERIAGA